MNCKRHEGTEAEGSEPKYRGRPGSREAASHGRGAGALTPPSCPWGHLPPPAKGTEIAKQWVGRHTPPLRLPAPPPQRPSGVPLSEDARRSDEQGTPPTSSTSQSARVGVAPLHEGCNPNSSQAGAWGEGARGDKPLLSLFSQSTNPAAPPSPGPHSHPPSCPRLPPNLSPFQVPVQALPNSAHLPQVLPVSPPCTEAVGPPLGAGPSFSTFHGAQTQAAKH